MLMNLDELAKQFIEKQLHAKVEVHEISCTLLIKCSATPS